MAGEASPAFRLSIIPRCRERIQALADRASAAGLGPLFARTLTELRRQLEARPREWGDPNYRYHGLGTTSYLRVEGWFRIVYAVDDSRPIVFLREVEPLPGHPLADT
jgi:mRNA-degrading endonuclease RelE of RelBE toxin-antitoxin system